MELIDLIDVEKICWSLVSQAFGFWLCWIMQAKPAKQNLEQLKVAARGKVASMRNHLKESEELLERLRTDYPHLMNAGPRKPTSPYHPRGWRYQ